MNFLRFSDSKWQASGIKCPRDEQIIFREVSKKFGSTHHFCCGREGCTWPKYNSNINLIINQINETANP